MLVKATKNMAAEIKKRVQLPEIESISIVKMPHNQFAWYVDCMGYHYEDYNSKTGLYSVIKITYAPGCYAMPRYLTTRELNAIFRDSDKTADGFFQELADAIAI